jgi:hypothetical protein
VKTALKGKRFQGAEHIKNRDGWTERCPLEAFADCFQKSLSNDQAHVFK